MICNLCQKEIVNVSGGLTWFDWGLLTVSGAAIVFGVKLDDDVHSHRSKEIDKFTGDAFIQPIATISLIAGLGGLALLGLKKTVEYVTGW